MQSYVGRGGLKLAFALECFNVDPAGKVAADLGSHIGGFVDCLLRSGAQRVYSVDTGYGQLAWKLRNDERVVVMERVNALHVELPEEVDVVTVDVGWTPQRLILPHALSLVTSPGVVLSLLKPQYEAARGELRKGVAREEALEAIVRRTLDHLEKAGIAIRDCRRSPVRGGGGNAEFFLCVDV